MDGFAHKGGNRDAPTTASMAGISASRPETPPIVRKIFQFGEADLRQTVSMAADTEELAITSEPIQYGDGVASTSTAGMASTSTDSMEFTDASSGVCHSPQLSMSDDSDFSDSDEYDSKKEQIRQVLAHYAYTRNMPVSFVGGNWLQSLIVHLSSASLLLVKQSVMVF